MFFEWFFTRFLSFYYVEIRSNTWIMSKRDGGKRCVAGGCSNNYNNGYTVYDLKCRRYKNRNSWIQFINTTRSDFKSRKACTVYLCDGHFDLNQFEPSQLCQYQAGFRSNAPQLLLTAVPTIKEAGLPHFSTIFRSNNAPGNMNDVSLVVDDDSVHCTEGNPRKRRRSNFLVQKVSFISLCIIFQFQKLTISSDQNKRTYSLSL